MLTYNLQRAAFFGWDTSLFSLHTHLVTVTLSTTTVSSSLSLDTQAPGEGGKYFVVVPYTDRVVGPLPNGLWPECLIIIVGGY